MFIDLPKLLSFQSADDRIASGVRVKDLLSVFKRMRIDNYFSRIHISSEHFIQKTNMSTSTSDTRTTIFFCIDPFWTAEVTLRCDSRYFDEIDDDSDGDIFYSPSGCYWRPAWYDEDLISILVRSKAGRSDFERSVSELMRSSHRMELEMRNPADWNSRGFDATSLCCCGHIGIIDEKYLSLHRIGRDIHQLQKSLKCSACGALGNAQILPTLRKSSQAAGDSKSWGYSESDKEDEVDLYSILDGDGTNDAYLADGIHVAPSGKLNDR